MIRINKDYVIDVSSDSYTLMEDKHTLDKHNKKVFKTLGYYTTLYGAFKGALDYEVKDSLSKGEYTLQEAITCVSALSDEFIGAFKKLTEGGRRNDKSI